MYEKLNAKASQLNSLICNARELPGELRKVTVQVIV